MGNKNPKIINEDKNSNSSVLNVSLESKKVKNSQNSENSDNIKDSKSIIEDLRKEVDLPIENEYEESSEFLLEDRKIKIFIEKDDENTDNIHNQDKINKKRSKSFAQAMPVNIKNTPRPHPKESNEYITPLKLSAKSFGNIQKLNKKPNAVIFDYEQNIIDCKSCNDEDSLDTFFLFNSDTERTTPNVEDLQNLLNCRKRMTIFRNSINDRVSLEYENILNSDYIFEKTNNKQFNNNQKKKNVFWYKYIKQQQNRNKHSISHTKRIMSQPLIDAYNIANEEDEDKKNNGLFILSILESAANERKGRKTLNA